MKSLSHLRFLRPWCYLCLLCLPILSCGPKAEVQVAPKTPPAAVFEQKMRWILQLEDERQIRGGGGDLIALTTDPEARVRRRAALAIGRVKLSEGIPALTTLLQTDTDAEVRQMGAFAMGLIGDESAAPALLTALTADAEPLIQGRAAEALGMLAHKAAVPAITTMMSSHVSSLSGINADDMSYPK